MIVWMVSCRSASSRRRGRASEDAREKITGNVVFSSAASEWHLKPTYLCTRWKWRISAYADKNIKQKQEREWRINWKNDASWCNRLQKYFSSVGAFLYLVVPTLPAAAAADGIDLISDSEIFSEVSALFKFWFVIFLFTKTLQFDYTKVNGYGRRSVTSAALTFVVGVANICSSIDVDLNNEMIIYIKLQ